MGSKRYTVDVDWVCIAQAVVFQKNRKKVSTGVSQRVHSTDPGVLQGGHDRSKSAISL